MKTRPDRRDRKAAAELAARLTALAEMDNRSLRREWRHLYGHEPPPRAPRKLLLLVVAYRIQERAFGGLSAAAKRQLEALGDTSQTRGNRVGSRAAQLRPGTRLIREWHGETHTVLVHEDGFEWRDARWRSLSAIARAITGARWSGPRFFGLVPGSAERDTAAVRGGADGP